MSGDSLYRFASAPQWATPPAPQYQAPVPSSGVSKGTWYLLLDTEINVRPDGADFYHHDATRVVSATGVDEQSQIDITVDPTYQSLSINALRVIRDGRTIDEKPLARITALPQETQLRERIYDGSYNINILLSDVRVGDVVEYAFTLHSTERNFPGLTSDRLSVGWSDPVLRQRLRVLAPTGLALSYRTEDGSLPVTRILGEVRELTWNWHDLTAIAADEHQPSWYSPWPHLELTSAKDWSEVVRRIRPLFEVRGNPPAVLAVVRQIREGGGSAADQALRALQFVQEQIRYVSISIGRGAYKPASPETVLSRRFGDCKDKALLLTTLLRQLGIEAQPALVNTGRGRSLDSALPTPYAFDHAIVRAQIAGQVFWLDGTAVKQFSPLSTAAPADFERALVVDPASAGLEVIPSPHPDVWRKRSEVLIDARAGIQKPAKLQISTFYEGELADDTRSGLADESNDKRQSDYINYIVRYYPSAKVAAPIKIIDDPVKNIIEVQESYLVEHPFTRNSRGRLQLLMHADELYRYLDGVEGSVRKSPFAIAFPVQIQQTVRALLPASWKVADDTVSISNPAFRYESKVSYSQSGATSQVTTAYLYQAKTDSVPVAALPQYLADRKRAFDDVGFSIWAAADSVQSASQSNTGTLSLRPAKAIAQMPLAIAGCCLLLALWLAYRFMFRWDPVPAASVAVWPVGIRGWLLVPGASVLVLPWALGRALMREVQWLDVDRWGSTLSPSLKLIHLTLIGVGVLLMVAQLLLAYLFFIRRSSAPRLFIACLWLMFAYILAWASAVDGGVFLWGTTREPLLGAEITGEGLRDGALTAYMLLSRRVKATFVRRLKLARNEDTRAVLVPPEPLPKS